MRQLPAERLTPMEKYLTLRALGEAPNEDYCAWLRIGRQREAQLIAEAEREAARSRLQGETMTIETLAEQHELRISRDDCGDPIIAGSRGHLYVDGDAICLMATDTRLKDLSKWENLGGKLWLGSISRDDKNRGIQDVKIIGLTNVGAAIAMIGGGARKKQISDETREHLRQIRPQALLAASQKRNSLP